VTDTTLPLGRRTGYPNKYAPELLCPIARSESRARLGIGSPLPFHGVDFWNAWELTWLAPGGLPRVATAGIRVPADSPDIVESKSLKLYLGSFAMTVFESVAAVADAIARDLGACVGAAVQVLVEPLAERGGRGFGSPPGTCLDTLDVECSDHEVRPELLTANASHTVDEALYTHLLRSLCPVTSQPDIGSLAIAYRGPRIDPAGLLRYVVSFREHQDFHEACVERMFVDIMARCAPSSLSVYARYQRRGGIDINPFRGTAREIPENTRYWRQ